MTFGSLFSGIGGIDLGLERAGMVCRWQAEADSYCSRVLAKHWPTIPNLGNVKTVDWKSVEGVDLIAGGPPCQPFSSASHGRKRGTADARWLWPEMFQAVVMLKPTWVLVENVTQFDGPALEQVVFDLEACGYEVAPTLEVPACAFGFDHWRRRLWILGYSNRYRKPGSTVYAEVAELSGRSGEPGRVGAKDGISTRVDRLAALGNACVPDVVEWIGRALVRVQASMRVEE